MSDAQQVAGLAHRIAQRTSLPFGEVLAKLVKLPPEVAKFVDEDSAGLALSLWVVLQLTDDECEAYWMHGYPKVTGERMQ